nr:MAG TPA: hypothetical protein [Caudoviricetes sp.]
METKINIAEILKDKPEGTKLWTDMFGSVTLYVVTVACDAFQVKHHNKEPWFDKDGKLYKEGVLCIYPSKSMRDWEKFNWKKDDVLVNSSGFKLFFDRWANDDYTRFFGKVNLLENSFSYETEKYTLASKDENLDTLEIEKPEFKDGDIVVTDAVPSLCYSKCIFILKGDLNTGESCANSYIFYNIDNNDFCFDVLDMEIRYRNIRLATEEEKQQLFSALANKGKAWDAEKKEVADLKPKVKPFDRVLVRDSKSDNWRANLFSYIGKDGYYHCVYANWAYCIPYEGNESLLGTTKDVEG